MFDTSTIGDAPVTVTDSSSEPTRMSALIVEVKFAGSSTPFVAAALLDALSAASARAVWEKHGFVVAP